jgi:LysR family transcriptional regulator, regulator for bpeEF and oprC
LELESTRIFVKVVHLGSFSRAAELLRLPKSTVSRAVSRLEIECGTKLLLRTTRNITLTASGRVFFESCVAPLQALEDARKSLNGQDSLITGVIRLTAPEDFGMHMISKVVGGLARQHSGLQFDLHFTNEIIDLVKEGFDLAIRIGKLNPSSFKVKKVGEIIMVPVASPQYLKQRAVNIPKDLSLCECLTIHSRLAKPSWMLESLEGKKISIEITPKVMANQMSSLMNLALQGVGVAFIPLFLCQSEILLGQLVRVLPDWRGEGLSVSLVSPIGFSASNRLKLVSTHLANSIQKALKYD